MIKVIKKEGRYMKKNRSSSDRLLAFTFFYAVGIYAIMMVFHYLLERRRDPDQ